jgi:energy-coupling factor transport system ATP-binding protein
VVVLADGEVVSDGPVRQVLSGSPAFAPQVAKILHPVRLLTVDEVVSATGAAS